MLTQLYELLCTPHDRCLCHAPCGKFPLPFHAHQSKDTEWVYMGQVTMNYSDHFHPETYIALAISTSHWSCDPATHFVEERTVLQGTLEGSRQIRSIVLSEIIECSKKYTGQASVVSWLISNILVLCIVSSIKNLIKIWLLGGVVNATQN